MGYYRSHTIAITSVFQDDVKEAHAKAKEIFDNQMVTEIISGTTNAQDSFFVAPDGSKEGWDESDKQDDNRKALIDWIDAHNDKKGCSYIQYVEMYFADDNEMCEILKHN